LLSIDFIKLVLVSIVVSAPLAWLAMNQWLSDYAYRIDIHWSMIVLTGILVIGIAVLTVSFYAIKTALVNPVKSLRTE
jgi:putative ABC transport system permease protein